MTLLLGIDLGTSYFKVGLFDGTGCLKGLGRVAVTTVAPQPGRCELPVDRFWDLLRRALAEALLQAEAEARQIVGVAYSSQASTFVLLDLDDRPLTPLVLWTDTRAAALPEQWRQFTLTEEFGRTTGFNGSSSNAAVAKWLWFQEHEPKLWRQTRAIMTIADYFTFALTGERVGDAGTAAFLGLYDLGGQGWWPKARSNFGVADKQLSQPLRPGSPHGQTSAAAEVLLGLPRNIPFAVGGLDHHVAALGSGLGNVADASISTGTVLAAVALSERVVPQARCYHGPHFYGTGCYRLAFDPLGAGQLEDYRRTFAPDCSIEQLIAQAEKVPACRPHRVASGSDRAFAVRYLLEKISHAHRCLLGHLQGKEPIRRIVATGGGARSGAWLQIQADMLGLPITVHHSAESACLGAAMLASVAAGLCPSPLAASKAMSQRGKQYLPDPANVTVYRDWSPTVSGANST